MKEDSILNVENLEDKKSEVEAEQAKVEEKLQVVLKIKDSIFEEILERLKRKIWKIQLNSNMIMSL